MPNSFFPQCDIMGKGGSRFLALSDELLIEIIAQIGDRQSLCNLARVSSFLQGLTEPFIWKSVVVRTGKQVIKLHKVLHARRDRLSAVQDLQIRYTYRDESGMEFFNNIMGQLVQLRHLTIESPCCNDNPWGDRLVLWGSSCRIEYATFFEEAVSLQLLASVQPKFFGQLRSGRFHFPCSLALILNSGLRSSGSKTSCTRIWARSCSIRSRKRCGHLSPQKSQFNRTFVLRHWCQRQPRSLTLQV